MPPTSKLAVFENGVRGELLSTETKMLVFTTLAATDAEELGQFFCDNDDPRTKRGFDPFPLTRESARTLTADTEDVYELGRLDGELVIFYMLRGWSEGFDEPSLGVLVHGNHRGRGLGRAAVSRALEVARRRGCPSVRLSVYLSNPKAMRLYQSLGFEEISRQAVVRTAGKDSKVLMRWSV